MGEVPSPNAWRWIRHPTILAVATLALSSVGCDLDRTPGGGEVTVPVDRVVDGDTAKVFLGGRSVYVRYIGIDTPESVAPGQPVECGGPEASEFNRSRIEGRKVRLVFDDERNDRYGRLLAYVYVDGRLLNAEILREGLAETLTIPPNDSFREKFARAEESARNAKKGIWSGCLG